MNIDKAVLRFAGFLTLLSSILSVYHNVNWIYLTMFVGFMMLQSSITGLCPIVWAFKRLGVKPGAAFK